MEFFFVKQVNVIHFIIDFLSTLVFKFMNPNLKFIKLLITPILSYIKYFLVSVILGIKYIRIKLFHNFILDFCLPF